jgi:hypothetical protein
MTILEEVLSHSHDWAVDRIHTLCDEGDLDDAYAIQSEFKEWFNVDILEHEILSLEYIED